MDKLCIYCTRRESDGYTLSDAHLIPRSLGGRLSSPFCCTECNNVIGWKVEAKVFDSLFFTFGMKRLKITSPENAFRKIHIEDDDSKEQYRYYGDELLGTPKIRDSGERVGPLPQLIQMWTGDIEKRFNKEWAEFAKDEVLKGRTSVRLPGEIHHIKKTGEIGNLTFTGLTSFPFSLLAKISYEAMFSFGFICDEMMRRFRAESIRVAIENGRIKSIDFNPDFWRRVGRYPHPVWKGDVDYEKLDYQPFHRLDCRITDRGNAYLRISFWRQLVFAVYLGRCSAEDLVNSEVLGRAYIFPMEGDTRVYWEPYPPELKERNDYENAVADIAAADWEQFVKDNS